ncbi:hypothetical protein DO72_4095 [Burkholderia pseudomallei]|nr:hypothetical protein DO72_4095 [Burkholderia pseudomallei]
MFRPIRPPKPIHRRRMFATPTHAQTHSICQTVTHCAGLPKPSTAVRRTSSESFRSPVRASVCRRGLGSTGAAAGE